RVSVVTREGPLSTSAGSQTVSCRKPFVITHLAPGQYWLEASAYNSASNQALWSSVPFEIVSKSVSFAVNLAKGAEISGRVTVSEGSLKIPFDMLRITLSAVGTSARQPDGRPDSAGGFHLGGVAFGEQRLGVLGLPESYYIRELTYNGAKFD